ncbi:hypothetical protein BN1723_020192 [Verticillium longisporum]|uniref:Uncharacterized protein n=1 Tax=Verticillium longisporum TaxID=100787 RepID=A0A0G4NKZ5_VERLO|nr:hypothetical protein BN1708_019672 [Verticillium longisporum]CRK47109.1 hypothetical protein BN1723_020192 [Verticillium longisporum]
MRPRAAPRTSTSTLSMKTTSCRVPTRSPGPNSTSTRRMRNRRQ